MFNQMRKAYKTSHMISFSAAISSCFKDWRWEGAEWCNGCSAFKTDIDDDENDDDSDDNDDDDEDYDAAADGDNDE